MKVEVDVLTLDEFLPEVDNPKQCRGCGCIVDSVDDFADEEYQLCVDCIQLKFIYPTESELEQIKVENNEYTV